MKPEINLLPVTQGKFTFHELDFKDLSTSGISVAHSLPLLCIEVSLISTGFLCTRHFQDMQQRPVVQIRNAQY